MNVRIKTVMYKGKEYSAEELSKRPEAEIATTAIRYKLAALRKKVEEGKASMSDDEILKCMLKSKRTNKRDMEILRKRKSNAKEWDLLDTLF